MQLADSEHEAGCAGVDVLSHRPQQDPQDDHRQRLQVEPRASAIDASEPSTTASEKYSAGPNRSATRARGGAATASTTVATVPAKNEPSAAAAGAGPALR